MSCAWARVLRSTTSSACARLRLVEAAAAKQPHPAENRVQRRAQLVGNRGDELVLAAAERFGFTARCLLLLEQRRAAPLGLARSDASRNTSTMPMSPPSAARIGAALSSMGDLAAVARQQQRVIGEADGAPFAEHACARDSPRAAASPR